MNIRELDRETLLNIYEQYCPLYFPAGELKPLSAVKRLLDMGIYRAYGFYRGSELLAFAYLIGVDGQGVALLDYFAVQEELRCGGIGGDCLRLLADYLQKHQPARLGLYIESEHPDFAVEEADRTLRARRVGFYERNGARHTGLNARLFDVDYIILYLPCAGDEAADVQNISAATHMQRLDAIYRRMFPKKYYDACVRIDRA